MGVLLRCVDTQKSDITACRLFHVGQSHAVRIAFVIVQIMCFWLRRCFWLSTVLLPPHTHTHTRCCLFMFFRPGFIMYHIVYTAAGIQAVVNQGLNGTLDGQPRERCAPLVFFLFTLLHFKNERKPGGWLVHTCPDSQKQTQGEESWSPAGGKEGRKGKNKCRYKESMKEQWNTRDMWVFCFKVGQLFEA